MDEFIRGALCAWALVGAVIVAIPLASLGYAFVMDWLEERRERRKKNA